MEEICLGVNEVEQQLKEAGEQLASSSSFATKDLLINLLDRIEILLTFVGQAPSISMQGALVPTMGALIGDELLKHIDVDVRVLVASCLCEVTRITAPEPPYKDDIMKEIFQLYVTAFAELSNVTGDSYYKAIHILESVAKVKSCLLMLDLECDTLVLEMFQQFLSHIRLNHPHNVFSDMETIMTLVIEESDEVATELLSLLIFHVKKENQSLSPASWNLAEKVLRNCNSTLLSYSETILKLINSDPDDYAEVVTLLCQNANENEPVVTKSTKSKNIHTRDRNSYVNGGSAKKQKTDAQKQLKGKELETSKRGRSSNKKNDLNQDSSPSLVQNSQEDARITRLQGKSKGLKVVKQEYDSSDYEGEELLMQQTNKVQKRSKPSSKKRVTNGSGGKENVKKWGQDLEGSMIQVWWPLDKMYYKGVVSSYDHVADKYKVLYADGDEEVLDLHHEKWRMVDEASPDRPLEQVVALPTPVTIPAKTRKQKALKKQESLPMPEENSNARKSPAAPADSTNTEPTKEDEIAGANTSNTNIPSAVDTQMDSLVQTSDVSSELKLTEKAPADTEPTKEDEIAGANTSNTNIPSIVDGQMDDLVQTPDISSELKLTEKPPADLTKIEDAKEQEIAAAGTSNTNIPSAVDSQMDDLVQTSDNSSELKLTENAPADIEPTKEDEIADANTPNTNIPSIVDSQMDDLVQTSDVSSEVKLTEKAPADLTEIEDAKEHEIAGADTSNTNIPSTVDSQMDDLVQTSDVSSELKLTEKALADSTKTEPTKEPEIVVADTTNTNVPSTVDSQIDDLVQNSDISSELKLTEKAPAETKIEDAKEDEIAGADTSNTNVPSTVDSQMDDLVQVSDISSEVKLTEETKIDMVEQEGEPNPKGELEEKSLPGPSETTQILEKGNDLAC